MRLNFYCLKIINLLHAKIIGHILENKQTNKCLNSLDYTINHRENEDENEK